ncbi:hypothetical protein SEA_CHEPLI_39 [Microbacterium phage Chepli]|nr:hypothetical protein SEA_CHEPLI_39 [Microbacterium phage Chepli]QZE10327.1 hypothetical protein SEA_KATCHAN_39 [Microbacterium phage KatChan]
MLNSKAPCLHATRKHHYKVVAWMTGNFSVLRCDHGVCHQHLVLAHEDILKLVSA